MPEVAMGMDKKQLLIVGGVGALGVGLVVYARWKAAQQAPPAEAFPDQQQGGGGGGGPIQVQAPNQGTADAYQNQLKQAEANAADLQNRYIGEQLRQSKAQFDILAGEHQQEFQIGLGAERAQAGYAAEIYTQEQKQLAKTGISCPGNASPRMGPDGQWFCRQKTSGGILGLPIGQVVDAISGFVGGVQSRTPQAGASATDTASKGFNAWINAQLGGFGKPKEKTPPTTPAISSGAGFPFATGGVSAASVGRPIPQQISPIPQHKRNMPPLRRRG